MSKWSRRNFLIGTLGIGAGALLAACAPQQAAKPAEKPAEKVAEAPKATEAPKAAPKKAQDIHFLCRSDIKPAYAADKAVETWNANNESKVILDEPPSGAPVDVKIQAAQAAGDLVWDGYWVMVMPHDAVSWSKRQIIQPFDPYLESTKIPNANKILPAIIPSIKASCTYEGKIVGMPGNVGSVGLAWQWEALRAVGMNDQPYTWDEVYRVAKEIKKAKPELVPFGSACTPLCDLWTMIWSAQKNPFDAKGLYDIRGEGAMKALEWLRKMVDEKLIYTEGVNTGLSQWLKGGWAMIICYDVAGTMAQKTFGVDKYETGINFFPNYPETNAGSPFWINSGVLLNKAKNPQGFTDFCCWWFGPDNDATGRQITEVAAKPCYTYMYEKFVKGRPEYAWEQKAIDLCAKSVPFPHNTTHGIQSSKASPWVQKVYDASQKFEPKVWMDSAYKDIEDEIAKQKL